jgi:hypothetical protein
MNPYARARSNYRLSKSNLLFLSFLFLLASILFLLFLPAGIMILGFSNLFLSVLNTWWLRAKDKPFLDLFFHGAIFALFFLTSYLFIKSLDFTGGLVAVIVFLGGVISELMRGVRNYDLRKGNNSVNKIGVRGSLIIIFVFFLVWILLVIQATKELLVFPIILYGAFIPIQYFLLPPLAFFLVYPIVESIKNHANATGMRVSFRKRALVIISIFFTMAVAVYLTGAGYQTYPAPPNPYSIDISVKTVIAGPEKWGVAFINFNYVDAGNHYYVLLNQYGTLELTKVVNYEKYFLSHVDTGLSPFYWHHFKIIHNGKEIHIYVDDMHFISLVDESPFHGDLVLKGEVSAKLAFFRNVHVSKL